MITDVLWLVNVDTSRLWWPGLPILLWKLLGIFKVGGSSLWNFLPGVHICPNWTSSGHQVDIAE